MPRPFSKPYGKQRDLWIFGTLICESFMSCLLNRKLMNLVHLYAIQLTARRAARQMQLGGDRDGEIQEYKRKCIAAM